MHNDMTPDRALPAALNDAIVDAPQRWEENQHLLLSRAIMSTLLLSFQQRLAAIVQRYQEDIRISLQTALVNPLGELRDALEAFDQELAPGQHAQLKTTFQGNTVPDLEAIQDAFMADVRTAIEEVPESIRTMPESAVQTLVNNPLGEVDAITVSLRRVIDYLVEMELLGPLQEEKSEWQIRAQHVNAIAQDVLRLTAFHLPDDGVHTLSKEEIETLKPILENGLERLTEELEQLEAQVTGFDQLAGSRLDMVVQQLNTYTITRSEGELQRYVRGHKGRLIQSRYQAFVTKTGDYFRERLVRLLYRRSEGVLFARKLQADDIYGELLNQGAIQRLMEAVMPQEAVLEALPLYYRQLFLGAPAISKELWVGGEEELLRARKAIDRWKRGQQGGLLITGAPLSGKTALAQLLAQTHFKRENTFLLTPASGGQARVEDLLAQLQKATATTGTAATCFDRLPHQSVLIIDDLQKWWKRSEDGFGALEELMSWMDQFGKQCFFIVTCQLHAFRLIERIHPISGQFLDMVGRGPSNAEQIQQIILLRHKSTGLRFDLDELPEEELSAWKLARLFTGYFDYARGNVGVALQAWIASIVAVSKDRITIKRPAEPEVGFMDRISIVQKAILVHLVLHDGLSMAQLHRMSHLDQALLRHEVEALKRSGWLEESEKQMLTINRFIAPHLTQALIDQRMM